MRYEIETRENPRTDWIPAGPDVLHGFPETDEAMRDVAAHLTRGALHSEGPSTRLLRDGTVIGQWRYDAGAGRVVEIDPRDRSAGAVRW